MNGLINEKWIIDAYVHLRETNSEIPSETLDFMKNASLEKLKNLGEPSEPSTLCCAKCADLQKAYAQQLINYLELFAEKEPELWEAIKIENKETIKKVIDKLEKAKRNK